jgi:hypothetical protein
MQCVAQLLSGISLRIITPGSRLVRFATAQGAGSPNVQDDSFYTFPTTRFSLDAAALTP